MKHGHSLVIPPHFDGNNYAYWKVRMKAFLKSIDERVWNSIEYGQEKPTTSVSEWQTSQKEAVMFNSKAMNGIFNAVSMEEFKRISNVEVAHTAWNILQTVHEGTKAIKINKLQQLTTRFESIRMSDDESFDEFYAKFNDIVNSAYNFRRNDPTKVNNTKKPKEKVGQISNNSISQQCFGCQGYGHVKSECYTFLRSKDKAMAVTLSDDEVFDNESSSDEDGNFIAFTATAVVDESVAIEKNPSDGELSEDADLQEAYNKLCKVATKDAMSIDLGLKKIASLELEKKILLVKLFDANELLNNVKTENMLLLDKVKNLELELSNLL